MKKYARLLIGCTLIISGVFLFTKVKATEYSFWDYSPDTTTPDYYVLYGNGTIVHNTWTANDFAGEWWKLGQDFLLQANQLGTPYIPISAVSIYAVDYWGGVGNYPDAYAVLYDQNDVSVATSTTRTMSWGDVGEIKFEFPSVYNLLEPNYLTKLVVYFDGFPANNIGNMFYLTKNEFPPIGLPDIYDGMYNGSSWTGFTDVTDGYDLAVKFYYDDTILKIDYPVNGQVMTDDAWSVYGTCDDDFDFSIYNGISYASSTYSFGESKVCPGSHSWSYNMSGLPINNYHITVENNTTTDSIIVIQAGMSKELTDDELEEQKNMVKDWFLSWTCDMGAIFGDPCSAVGTFFANGYSLLEETINGFRTQLTGAKPISYFIGTYDAIKSGIDATATSTITNFNFVITATTSEYFNGTITMFDMSFFDDILTKNQWSTLKNIVSGILWLSFGFLLFYRLIKLI